MSGLDLSPPSVEDGPTYFNPLFTLDNCFGRRPRKALNHYPDALQHTTNEVEKRFLKKKIDELQKSELGLMV